jgi:hypothetical protein
MPGLLTLNPSMFLKMFFSLVPFAKIREIRVAALLLVIHVETVSVCRC